MEKRLKARRFELLMQFFAVPFDLIIILLSAYFAYIFRENFGPTAEGVFMPLSDYLKMVVLVLPLFVLVFFANNIYSPKPRGLLSSISSIVVAVSTVFMLIFAILFLTRTFFFSRLVIVYGWIICVILVSIGKGCFWLFQKYLYKKGFGRNLVVIVGTNQIAKILSSRFVQNGLGDRRVIAFVDIKDRIKARSMDGIPIVKKFSTLSKKIDLSDISEIIWTEKGLDSALALELVGFCQENKIRFRYIPNLFATRFLNVDITAVAGIPIIELKKTPLEGWRKILKRIIDITGSIVGLIVLSPIFLIIAILIKTDSQGPVIFTQERVGENKNFKIYKFRTMVKDASKLLAKIRQKTRDTGPFYNVKVKDDPRLTRVGKVIRKGSVDELPQLWNVLKGEMSLVGPRPLAPQESHDVEKYEKQYQVRRYVLPGMTGLWQVSGRSEMSTKDRIKLDIYYTENWSLILDFQIIIKTFWAVFTKKGAK